MSALSYADRQKLAAILARLGSPFEGEVTAAGLVAARFIRLPPVSCDVIVPWRQQVAACLAQPGSLRKWEVNFLNSLRTFSKISSKQREIQIQITDRVLKRAA